MFPKSRRLSREELSKVIKSGISIHSVFFTIKYTKNTDFVSKTAFIISKKELKHSVDRNRAKRRVRMAFRNSNQFDSMPGFMAIFIKKSVIKADFSEIVDEFNKIGHFTV